MKAFTLKTSRWLGIAIAGLLGLIAIFLLSAWIGSAIPRGKELPANVSAPITIMIETNGVHTQFVFPITGPHKDWRETFPSANAWVDGFAPTHIAIGFGEREVFLNTPTVSDLELDTAARILLSGGDGLIRVSNLVNPPVDQNRRRLMITAEQYLDLVAAIEKDLPALQNQIFRDFETGTYDDGAYYHAIRSYTVLSTCNQWTSDRLADAEIRTGLWTPFSGGVMKWVPMHTTELAQ
ncbi:MAG: DUF2459 domain-containing protein [Erythrobacter sp.]